MMDRGRSALGSLALAITMSLGCSKSESVGDHAVAGAAGAAAEDAGKTDSSTKIELDGGGDAAVVIADPKTCAEAESSMSYIGCDFWPTPVANSVWSIFDFAVVVANAGDEDADVQIERSGQIVTAGKVPANGLSKFYLPWIPELKGQDSDTCGNSYAITQSVRVTDGGYHLTSSVPVAVYQFNALEYRGEGGPANKQWSECPGAKSCSQIGGYPIGCFSFTNDASLLLPTSALTGNYRVISPGADPQVTTYFAITATHDQSTVTVTLSSTANIAGGNGIGAMFAGESAQFTLNQGEVLQLVGPPNSDLSGTLVQSDRAVQVIAGSPCITLPNATPACDHVEQLVPPAETLGKHYVVASPTGSLGNRVGHIVRIFGNVNGTKLSYPGGAPPKAPKTIDAGQVVDLGIVTEDFEVVGDQAFLVASLMLGSNLIDPNTPPPDQKGDPSMSFPVAVEQFRTKYVFLAPDDYDVSYADVIVADGTQLTLDGSPLFADVAPISSGYGVLRMKLDASTQGAHRLEGDKPFGLQVMGYGSYTSYYLPGGLNLGRIAPRPR